MFPNSCGPAWSAILTQLASGGSPAVIERKGCDAFVFLFGARPQWRKAEEDLLRAFLCFLATWTGRTPSADTRPYEITAQVEKAGTLRGAGFAVLLLECLFAICIGVLSWDMAWPIAAAAAIVITAVLASIASVFVHIVSDRNAEEDPRKALRRIDSIAMISMTVWTAAIIATLLASRLSSTGAALLALFHLSLLLLTIATPVLAAALFSKAAIYDRSRPITLDYHHLIETRNRLDRLELEARRSLPEIPEPRTSLRTTRPPK
jgi:hypothetical protein